MTNAPCLRLSAVISFAFLSGCQLLPHREPAAPAVVVPVTHEPLATHTFTLDDVSGNVVGEVQITKAQAEDTLPDIARRFNLGYEEIVRANPGVDPWLPGDGRDVVLPTQFVLPDAPRKGLVINLAALRVFYFPPRKAGEPQRVITHPIGIGKVGWSTPEGVTKITSKRKDPTWTPPASVRKEHKENGDPLPDRVPPGPDNPLGAYMMTLGWPSYLVHGTNKPYGVGMRSSHGCIRLYPEDIALLFKDLPIGTEVHVVNQPLAYGWRGNDLYVQVFPALEHDTGKKPAAAADATLLNTTISQRMGQQAKEHNAALDMDLVTALAAERRGISVPVSKHGESTGVVIAAARRVENRIPAGATWNGEEGLLVSAEEFEAARTGAAPAKPKAVKKSVAPAASGT
jgi:L,D-transpeptidase ErfK/SrfK